MSYQRRRPIADRVKDFQVPFWNTGVLNVELRRLGLVNNRDSIPDRPIEKGTVLGTKNAITQVYDAYLNSVGGAFDVFGFESSIPRFFSTKQKEDTFKFKRDQYPPHLETIPWKDVTPLTLPFDFGNIGLFDFGEIVKIQGIIAGIIPTFIDGDPYNGKTIDEVVSKNWGVFDKGTIVERPDWYSDAVFGQQWLTGPDPTVIALASGYWVERFKRAATAQGNTAAVNVLSNPQGTFYVADYSDLRVNSGLPTHTSPIINTDDPKAPRYGAASVGLFLLSSDRRSVGKLHPVSIILDFQGTIGQFDDSSVVIFNRRLSPNDSVVGEATDWPWRYAKSVLQMSSWNHHEITTHLVRTHLVEEAVIVAMHRSFTEDDPIFELMEPHWYKTLSLNKGARDLLVPSVITKISGFAENGVYNLINNTYAQFDWTAHFVPNDLANRGFPVDDLDEPKFHNAAYARNIILMWDAIRTFVSSYLESYGDRYATDAAIAANPSIRRWVAEMKAPDAAALVKFPDIKTRDQLVNVLTMCIHIAAPQHNAVNYLQEYYQSFVLNKPPALYTPLPANIQALSRYTEKDLVQALPINRAQQWLLASHVAYLLSFKVAASQNLINYVMSVAKLWTGDRQKAAVQLYDNLLDLKQTFKQISQDMDDQTKPYDVMDPDVTAVSILI